MARWSSRRARALKGAAGNREADLLDVAETVAKMLDEIRLDLIRIVE